MGTDHGIGDHNEILLIGKIFAFYIRVASVLLENLHIKGGCGGEVKVLISALHVT